MKCVGCSQEKDETEFEIANVINGVPYRRRKCRRCKQDVQNTRREAIRLWYCEYRTNLKCECCGFSDYRALHFHHKDPTSKEANVSNMVGHGASKERILAEIAKCAVLCANCHAIEHFEE
jgi:hypothetical protein